MTDDEIRVCAAHIGEDYLRAEVESFGIRARCHYCDGADEPTISLEELANHIEGAFNRHYERTSDQPDSFESAMLGDSEIGFEWFRHGEPVVDAIADATEIENDIATDIQQILESRFGDLEADQMGEETEFAEDSHYDWKEASTVELQHEWDAFEETLKTESRFFNATGAALLESLFGDLTQHQTQDDKKIIVDAGPGKPISAVYRARVFDNDQELEEALKFPARELGPPPFRKARAGRMNAHGISVLYASLDATVALAEIRPPVGGRVLTGRFEFVRAVRLLDLEGLRKLFVTGSIFDPSFKDKLQLARFLEEVSSRMTHPVLPSDEPFEYLVTQAIADYLATQIQPPLDGILFPSVQLGQDRMNVVLFHKSSAVVPDDVPEGTEITVRLYESTEDGDVPDIWVWEKVPPQSEAEPAPESRGLVWDDLTFGYVPTKDFREPTLTLDVSSIEVRQVQAVQFTTENFEVKRHRSLRSGTPPKFAKTPLPPPDF